MAALHDALKTLGPLNYDETPLDDLAPFLSSTFSAAQLIVDSVPIPSASSPPTPSQGRSRSASSASDISLSNARTPPPEKDVEALQKEWKSVKMNAKDNPLGMFVYKLGGKDGKGAWFARRSVHEGLGFSKWKRGLEREFPETMKVQGGPGEGNIRGIGGEKRVAFKEVEGVGKVEGPGAKGEVMDIPRDDDEDECNPIEWIMITRSDPGGSVPRFMIERGTPGGIVADASKFLNWACAKDIEDLQSDEDEELEQGGGDNEDPEQKAQKHEHHHNHEKDLHNWQTNGHLAGIEEVATPTEEKNLVPEQASADSSGIYAMVAGAAGVAGGYITSHTPAIISDHLPHQPEEPHGVESSPPRHDSVSSISSVSSGGSFASALDRRATNETADGASLRNDSAGLIVHDKELQKLEEKKRKLDERLSLTQAIKKAQEKHEREVKKQEEKYKREVERLERKKEKEAKKAEEKKRKAAEKDDKVRMARELEEAKAEVEVLKKEKELLRSQVGDLQAENT
ncbi:Reticulocyte-binding protein-like protein a, partial [Lachnellula willkommii]